MSAAPEEEGSNDSKSNSHYRSWADRVGMALPPSTSEDTEEDGITNRLEHSKDGTNAHDPPPPELPDNGGVVEEEHDDDDDDEESSPLSLPNSSSEPGDAGGCCAAAAAMSLVAACDLNETTPTADADGNDDINNHNATNDVTAEEPTEEEPFLVESVPEFSVPAVAVAEESVGEGTLPTPSKGTDPDDAVEGNGEGMVNLEPSPPPQDEPASLPALLYRSAAAAGEEELSTVATDQVGSGGLGVEVEVIDLSDAEEPDDGSAAPMSAARPRVEAAVELDATIVPHEATTTDEDGLAVVDSTESTNSEVQPVQASTEDDSPADESKDPSSSLPLNDTLLDGSGSDSEQEIEFGTGLAASAATGDGNDDDSVAAGGDDPDLDALLASTTDFAPEPDTSFDDMLDELLDDHHAAAEELETLMTAQQRQQQQQQHDVPYIGDVDEASKVQQSLSSDEATVPAEIATATADSVNPLTSAVSATVPEPKMANSKQKLHFLPNVTPSPPRKLSGDLSFLQPVKDQPGPPSNRLTRPNLAARMTGTRRYTPPKKKQELKVIIPPPSGSRSTSRSPRKSSTPKVVSPVKSPAKVASPSPIKSPPQVRSPSSASGTPSSSASAAPPKKRSFLQTFTRALSSSSSSRKPSTPSPRSHNATAAEVLPTLRPIEPTSRLLKETSASLSQRRDRFIPPPATFPSLSEVIRAIHNGAFDRRSGTSPSSPGRARSDKSRSPKHSRQ